MNRVRCLNSIFLVLPFGEISKSIRLLIAEMCESSQVCRYPGKKCVLIRCENQVFDFLCMRIVTADFSWLAFLR